MARLIDLKNKLLARAPEVDDSSAPEPPEHDLPALHAWFRTLAPFDAIATGRRKPWPEGDGTRGHCLAAILRAKLDALQFPGGSGANLRPDLNDLSLELVNLCEEHEYWVRESNDDLATAPSYALVELEAILAVLNPSPIPITDFGDRIRSLLNELLSGRHDFRSAVYGKANADKLVKPLARCKTLAERVYQGLRLKIGTHRSAFALLRRFKARCQTHDRVRMQKLAADAEVNELALTSELALWLFDQGLNPITEVAIAGVRADILDPRRHPASALYVEAKQYKQGDPIRRRIQRAMYQVYTSVGRLRSDRLDLTEAFLVVFRRSGALVHLPEEVPAEAYVVFPIVIDIAEQTGSKEKERPIEMTLEELRPAVVERVACEPDDRE